MSFECLFAGVKWLRFLKGGVLTLISEGPWCSHRRLPKPLQQPLRFCLAEDSSIKQNCLLLPSLMEKILQNSSTRGFYSFIHALIHSSKMYCILYKHRTRLGFWDTNTWFLPLNGPQCDIGQTCDGGVQGAMRVCQESRLPRGGRTELRLIQLIEIEENIPRRARQIHGALGASCVGNDKVFLPLESKSQLSKWY